MMPPRLPLILTTWLLLAWFGSVGNRVAAQAPESTVKPPANFVPDPDIVSESVWFDQDQGEIRPLELEDDRPDAKNRDTRWQATPASNANAAGGGWTGTGQLGQAFGWLLLATLFGIGVVILCYAFESSDFQFNQAGDTAQGRSVPQSARITRRRMAELPQELQQDDTDLRARAEEAMRNGEHDRALVLLFGHQLLLLDAVGWLRLTRGKTNRQYVRETRRMHQNASTVLASTVTRFERSFFGKHPIKAGDFEELWQANLELETYTQATEQPPIQTASNAEPTADEEADANAREPSQSDA